MLGFFLDRGAVAGMLIAASYYTARLLRGALAQRLDQQGQGRGERLPEAALKLTGR